MASRRKEDGGGGGGAGRSDEAQSADQLSAVMSLPACTITSSFTLRGASSTKRSRLAFTVETIVRVSTVCLQSCIDLVLLLGGLPANNSSFSKITMQCAIKKKKSLP